MTTKTCKKCGETKALDCFPKARGCKDGHRGECKTCNGASLTAWRKTNPEKVRASLAAWRKTNPEKQKERTDSRISGLTDVYVRKLLHFKAGEATPELIAAKREQLQIHRLTQQLKKEIRNV